MKKRDQIVKELEANLEKLNLKVDEFEKKFTALKGDVRQKYKTEFEKLQTHREKIRYELSLLKSAGESAYGEIEKGVKNAFQELNTALQSAKEKLGF